MQVQCDKCSAVSDSVTPETYLEGDIEFTFCRCPACGEIYPVCATDSALTCSARSSCERLSNEQTLNLYFRKGVHENPFKCVR